jgi:glutamyl-tRNA synthetase
MEIPMSDVQPRVRFAPSPTGYLHVGGLRTALYNYLFAKRYNGKFILRIEDTDRNRLVEGAVEKLIDSLKWCGLEYDEGPGKGGNFGPYIQSERLSIYKENVDKLIEKGNAYYCFCTPERLGALREEQQKLKLPQAKYDKHCLSLSKEEINANLASGMPYVVRLNVPPDLKIHIKDIVRGDVEFDSGVVDDQVLLKSDGYPTYHLANVVDDYLMGITHVIRGEEWLSSTPKHVLLYDFFGWRRPEFAHLPLLLNPDKSKLSKRQGDVAVEDYRDKGYLKEALINFVALLGWTAGDDQEFYHLDELVEKFSLERVNKAGAVFNVEKLNWLNAEHLRKKPKEEILSMLKTEIENSEYKQYTFTDELLNHIIDAMLERVSFVKEFLSKAEYLFKDVTTYEEETVKKRWKEDSSLLLAKYAGKISMIENPVKEDYELALHQTAEENNTGNGKVIHPLRLAVSGVGGGPGVFDICVIIGKEAVLKRIANAIEILK